MNLSNFGKQPEKNISANDLVGKMMQAHSAQQLGHAVQALEIYKQVIALDPDGACGQSAKEAVREIDSSRPSDLLLPAQTHENALNTTTDSTPHQDQKQDQKRKHLFLEWFLNLSITKKHLLILLTSELLFLALAGIGSQLIRDGLKTQLFNQAKSELAVSEINYNAKISQMAVGFQAQSENPAIINLAKIPPLGRNGVGYLELQDEARQLLQNQLKTLKIEYSTLVGKDLRIVASANAQRQGEIFNPNNLVAEVIGDPRQIKASEIISSAELVREGSPLPPDFGNQDALIRYTVTPVRDPATLEVVGALVSGDIVNGKPLISQETVKAFGAGYSAIYSRTSTGAFILASAFTKPKLSEAPQLNQPLPPTSLIASAAAANGEPVTSEVELDGQTYAMAAKSLPTTFKKVANGWLPGYSANPVTILVRGTPENEINALVEDSLNKLALSAVILIIITVVLSLQLGQLITKPISQLQEITKKFSQGDRRARAEVFGADEVGQLAIAFNQMADNIVSSEAVIRERDMSDTRLIERSHLYEIQAQEQRQEREKQAQRIIDFLLEIEGAKSGDLTVQASVGTDEIGSIADAFNATVVYLRQTIADAQAIAKEAEDTIENNVISLYKASNAMSNQDDEIAQIKEIFKGIRASIPILYQSSQDTAVLAAQALTRLQQTSTSTNESVIGIDRIKTVIADTAKKANCLYASSQEISKIIHVIPNISEKINILALNASIEAVKAGGDNSEGLRIIADEIRSFAQQLADSIKGIESLTTGIQKQSSGILQTIEIGKTKIDDESSLLKNNSSELQELTNTAHNIISRLHTISGRTQSQIEISQKTSDMLETIELTLETTLSANQKNTGVLQILSNQIQSLQLLLSKFKVKK